MNESRLEPNDWLNLLTRGEISVLGQMPWSSNATFLVDVELEQTSRRAIYKPGRGERPLRDFSSGLYVREVAAYALSVATGLDVIPETVVRDDAPLGPGSLQRFIDADFAQHYFTLVEAGGHEPLLRLIAGFDILANNADRKGGHLLIDAEDRIWGIDNGLCFHVEDKLRTVMWDFAGDELPGEVVGAARVIAFDDLPSLAGLLSDEEFEALRRRAHRCLANPTFPYPQDDHRAWPWPLV